MARSIAAKHAQGVESTLRIIEVFSHMLEKEASRSHALLDLFKTQNTLASWCSVELGIKPQSINTFRKNMDLLYPDGLRQFEEDRKKLFKYGQAQAKGSKAALTTQITELEDKKQRLVDSIILMSTQYADLLERVCMLAPKNKLVADLLRNHKRAYPEKIPHLREA